MKQLLLLAAVVSVFGCAKEQIVQTIPGTWTIVETNDGSIGMGYRVQTYSPSTEITLQFGNDGSLILSGSNPGVANSPLWEYDRYEIAENHIIRFYQSNGRKQKKAYYEIEGSLFLNYVDNRHGYEERFLRIR